jgi:hypothetical protein
MTRELIQAAIDLADTLRRENAALAALDMAAATRLLAEKQAATAAFAAAQAGAASTPDNAGVPRALLEQVAKGLRGQAEENRLLLERAMLVQSRVLGALARAVPQALAVAPRYDRGGSIAGARRPPAVALSARA